MKLIKNICDITQEEADECYELDMRIKYALRREGFDEYKYACDRLNSFYRDMVKKYGLENFHSLSVDRITLKIITYTPEELGKTVADMGDMEPPNTQ